TAAFLMLANILAITRKSLRNTGTFRRSCGSKWPADGLRGTGTLRLKRRIPVAVPGKPVPKLPETGEPRDAGMWERLEKREIRRRSLHAPFGTRPRPDMAPGTDLIPKIKHIVILMQENHSYDNYLGTLSGRGDGLPLGP